MKDEKRVLILITNLAMRREIVQNQERAKVIFESKGIPYDTIDGSDLALKEQRNMLFEISGMRGVYPQFFLLTGEDRVDFLGDWEAVEAMNDASGLPDHILKHHPEIMTWDRVLAA